MHISKYISHIFCWRQAGGQAWKTGFPTHVRRHCIQPDQTEQRPLMIAERWS